MLLTSRRQRRARSVAPVRRSTIDPSLVALLKARRTWICRIESALAPLDLSSTELSALRALRDVHEPLTYRELALASAKLPSELDGVIQSLLAKGLVLHITARGAENSARVCITPAGVLRHAEGARALDEVSATFAALMPDNDREAFDRIVSLVASG